MEQAVFHQQTGLVAERPSEPGLPREINLGQLVSAISLAFDFAERAQLNHARRVAYLALRLGERIGLADSSLRRLLFAGMLHDVGATEDFNEVQGDRVVRGSPVYDHPLRGAETVAGLPRLSDVGPIIAQHHERWSGGGYPLGLAGEAISLEARLLNLVDRFEVVYATAGFEPGLERVERRRGSDFQPELVDAFLAAAKVPRLQLDLEERNIGRVVTWDVERFAQVIVTAELRQVAGVFAALIDHRSPYTAHHSFGVAQVAGRLARQFCPGEAPSVEVAALLHDLGKVGVPSRILDKPGPLSPEEYRTIQIHPYYTEHILRQVNGFGDIVPWAAMHHERLDGSGYHGGVPAAQIPLESRIIAVSDVYEALTADRPYRKGLAPDEALQTMSRMAGGHLDPRVVQSLAGLT